tara:strand:- start:508 stop:708 length:201 start_codon:yes stop_codon:yes gene_type:complete
MRIFKVNTKNTFLSEGSYLIIGENLLKITERENKHYFTLDGEQFEVVIAKVEGAIKKIEERENLDW